MNKFLLALFLSLMLMFPAFAADKGNVTLTSDNTIVLDDAIMSDTVARVMLEASLLDSKLPSGEPLYLVLSSPGGSIQDGLEMIDYLKNLNRPVHTVTIFSASMAFQTVQQLGDRLIVPFGTLMAHKARGGFQGEFPGQIDSRYVYWIKRLNKMDEITAGRTNGKYTVQTLQSLYENEHWVDGSDAVAEGLADRVVGVRCDQSLTGTKNQPINFMGFSLVIVKSKCPMNQGIIDVIINIQTNQGLMTLNDFLAKGGSLTKTSTTSTYYSGYGYGSSYDHEGPAPKEPPVPTTDGLTLENINKEVNKIKESYRTRKAIVKE